MEGHALFEIEDCIAFLASRTSKKLVDQHEKRLAPAGITRTQWMALYYIGKHPEITQRELAGKLNSREPSVARLLDRMENDGLVRRVHKDRRTNSIEATDKGKTLLDYGMEITERFRDEALRDIPAEDVEAFRRVLAKLTANVGPQP